VYIQFCSINHVIVIFSRPMIPAALVLLAVRSHLDDAAAGERRQGRGLLMTATSVSEAATADVPQSWKATKISPAGTTAPLQRY